MVVDVVLVVVGVVLVVVYVGQVDKEVCCQSVFVVGEDIVFGVVIVGVEYLQIVEQNCYFWCV